MYGHPERRLENGDGFSRASYATSYEKLVDATDRIDAFVQSL